MPSGVAPGAVNRRARGTTPVSFPRGHQPAAARSAHSSSPHCGEGRPSRRPPWRHSGSATYSVFIMPPAVSSLVLQQFADFLAGIGFHLIQNLFRGFLLQFGKRVGGFIRRHFFDDVGGDFGLERFQNAGLHLGIDFGKASAATSLSMVSKMDSRSAGPSSSTMSARSAGCRRSSLSFEMFSRRRRSGSASTMLQNSQRMECGGIGRLQAANQRGRQHALEQPPEDAANADVDFDHVRAIARAVVHQIESDVVHAHHLAAVHIDDLLVEKIAVDAQHVLVGVIGNQVSRRRDAVH